MEAVTKQVRSIADRVSQFKSRLSRKQDKNVAKPKLGEKQLCPKCEKKFYDLARRPVVCPYCSHSFDPAVAAAPGVEDVTNETSGNNENDEDVEKTEEDMDDEEAAAKELELDGNATSFMGDPDDDDDDDDSPGSHLDGFSDSKSNDKDALLDDDDETSSTDDDDDRVGI